MIYSLLLLLALQSQKSQVYVPFAKVDTISSARVLVHYACADRWVRQPGFFPVYMEEKFVGIASCSHIGRDGWIQAKVWLNRQIGEGYSLRANLKVRSAEFNQDGCYWQVNEADITGMVYTRSPSRYD